MTNTYAVVDGNGQVGGLRAVVSCEVLSSREDHGDAVVGYCVSGDAR